VVEIWCDLILFFKGTKLQRRSNEACATSFKADVILVFYKELKQTQLNTLPKSPIDEL
jgi:hypothetical protein